MLWPIKDYATIIIIILIKLPLPECRTTFSANENQLIRNFLRIVAQLTAAVPHFMCTACMSQRVLGRTRRNRQWQLHHILYVQQTFPKVHRATSNTYIVPHHYNERSYYIH